MCEPYVQACHIYAYCNFCYRCCDLRMQILLPRSTNRTRRALVRSRTIVQVCTACTGTVKVFQTKNNTGVLSTCGHGHQHMLTCVIQGTSIATSESGVGYYIQLDDISCSCKTARGMHRTGGNIAIIPAGVRLASYTSIDRLAHPVALHP